MVTSTRGLRQLVFALAAAASFATPCVAQRQGQVEMGIGLGFAMPIFGPVLTVRYFLKDAVAVSCGIGTFLLQPMGQCFGEGYLSSTSGTSLRLGVVLGSNATHNIIEDVCPQCQHQHVGPAFGFVGGVARAFSPGSAHSLEVYLGSGLIKNEPSAVMGDYVGKWTPAAQLLIDENMRVRR